MGYTHYWYREPELDSATFALFINDCKKIIDYSQNELGIALAGGNGSGLPMAEPDILCFNGSNEQPAGQWTTNEQISIPWPAPLASIEAESTDPTTPKTAGNWFAGSLVSQRVAPVENLTGLGSGSYETVCIEQKESLSEWAKRDGDKLVFGCCKTAYRPYDLTATACLIALKHHFPASEISSDGEEKDWLDGQILCNNILGYGMDFEID